MFLEALYLFSCTVHACHLPYHNTLVLFVDGQSHKYSALLKDVIIHLF